MCAYARERNSEGWCPIKNKNDESVFFCISLLSRFTYLRLNFFYL